MAKAANIKIKLLSTADTEEIHSGRADEAGDEQIGRAVVEVERRCRPAGQPVMHGDDAVGQVIASIWSCVT
jgi:hypothetical protein